MFMPSTIGSRDLGLPQRDGSTVQVVLWLRSYEFEDGRNKVGMRSDLIRGDSLWDVGTTNDQWHVDIFFVSTFFPRW